MNTSEPLHTEGPWRPFRQWINGESREIIGVKSEVTGAVVATFGIGCGVLTRHYEGNAHLIAAAPDLLAACKFWDEGFVEGEQFTPEQFRVWVNDNRRTARAAIAKAEPTAPKGGL